MFFLPHVSLVQQCAMETTVVNGRKETNSSVQSGKTTGSRRRKSRGILASTQSKITVELPKGFCSKSFLPFSEMWVLVLDNPDLVSDLFNMSLVCKAWYVWWHKAYGIPPFTCWQYAGVAGWGEISQFAVTCWLFKGQGRSFTQATWKRCCRFLREGLEYISWTTPSILGVHNVRTSPLPFIKIHFAFTFLQTSLT